jgi:hypothetical protein
MSEHATDGLVHTDAADLTPDRTAILGKPPLHVRILWRAKMP